jgi:hypothetical protein
MHILVAKQFNNYISDGKINVYRVKAGLLHPYWMLMRHEVNRTAGLARCSSPLANRSYVGSVERNYVARSVSRNRALADDAGRVGCEFEAGMRTRNVLPVGAVWPSVSAAATDAFPSARTLLARARRSKSKPNSCDPLKMPASNEARLHGADAFSLKKLRQTARE